MVSSCGHVTAPGLGAVWPTLPGTWPPALLTRSHWFGPSFHGCGLLWVRHTAHPPPLPPCPQSIVDSFLVGCAFFLDRGLLAVKSPGPRLPDSETSLGEMQALLCFSCPPAWAWAHGPLLPPAPHPGFQQGSSVVVSPLQDSNSSSLFLWSFAGGSKVRPSLPLNGAFLWRVLPPLQPRLLPTTVPSFSGASTLSHPPFSGGAASQVRHALPGLGLSFPWCLASISFRTARLSPSLGVSTAPLGQAS